LPMQLRGSTELNFEPHGLSARIVITP